MLSSLLTVPLMKASLTLLFALALALPLRAQADSQYTPEQLDQMLAPIALYPDPLIAIILPASTAPSDITVAAQFVAGNGDPSAIDSQAWDPSVKALAHYPEVLKWMNDNADWTNALGAAFAMQPSDVMKSVQQLRARARAAGTLVSTPQQVVDVEGDDIRIVPATDNQIYVPQYDADDVYDESADSGASYVTFGPAYPVGPWLGFEVDWDDYGIWAGPWHSGWAYRRDWRNSSWGGSRWHPDARRGRDLVRANYRPFGEVPHPRAIIGAGRPRVPAAGSRPLVQGRAFVQAPSSRPDYRGRIDVAAPRAASPAPSGSLYGGMTRGTQARDFSNRGHTSRQAPVRSAPAHSAPARSAPAPSGGHDKQH
jgi:hypothetical protein